MAGKIIIVVGGQYGSEAKGQAIETLAKAGKMDVCVRTGAINAGHTVYYEGKPYAMQTVPAGWVGGTSVTLVIGRGAYIEQAILHSEIQMVKTALGVEHLNLLIDPMAGVHTEEHELKESSFHKRFGSTGKGCMAASVDKMGRAFEYKNFGETEYAKMYAGTEFILTDTSEFLNRAYDQGQQIVLEGTQGTLLDLYHGDYPYVTSRSTIASNWLMEAGLAPTLDIEVIMVCRTFPIRVAGNSGPLPDEIGWGELVNEIGPENVGLVQQDVDDFIELEQMVANQWGLPCLPHKMTSTQRVRFSAELVTFHSEVFMRLGLDKTARLKTFMEMTTVTKKLRRIGRFNLDQLKRAVELNRPTSIFLTFANYKWPSVVDTKTLEELNDKLSDDELLEFSKFLSDIEEVAGCKVTHIGTGRQSYFEVKE